MFFGGFFLIRGIMVLGVSGSWRLITPGKESLGLGSRRTVAARFALRTSGETRGWKRAYYFSV